MTYSWFTARYNWFTVRIVIFTMLTEEYVHYWRLKPVILSGKSGNKSGRRGDKTKTGN